MDQNCKFWVRPSSVKIQIFERFFKHCVCLIGRLPLVKISAKLNNIWESRTQNPLQRDPLIDAESIRKTLKVFNFTTTKAILMKLITDIYLNIFFHLPKSWGIRMNLKISFLAQFRPFRNTSIKTLAYLMHHLTCSHWSKFQTKLTTSYKVLAKRPPKSSLKWVSTATKTFENLKLESYRSDIAKTCSLCLQP